jgi:signal transduction protein with GAF and PtsI domain
MLLKLGIIKFNIMASIIDSDVADLIAAGGLLLFTGGEVGASDSIVEIISKFGVVAVLWYWLKDMKGQMRTLLATFDKETNEIREHYDKVIAELRTEHNDYKDRLDKQLDQRTKEVTDLNEKIFELTKNNDN